MVMVVGGSRGVVGVIVGGEVLNDGGSEDESNVIESTGDGSGCEFDNGSDVKERANDAATVWFTLIEIKAGIREPFDESLVKSLA